MVGASTRLTLAALAVLCVSSFGTTVVLANFKGDGTYYGDNGWAGWCAGNVPNEGKPWPPPGGQYGTRVALNMPQFDNGAHCGRKLMYRGLNPDCTTCGGSPVTTDWQPAQVTNLCPECKFGDLDQGIQGDGRWQIEWYWQDEGPPQGGMSTESSTAARAAVPAKAATTSKSSYDWRGWLRKASDSRKTAYFSQKGRKLAR